MTETAVTPPAWDERIAELLAENNRLRSALGAADYFAATWADLIIDMPHDYRCTLTCAEANAAADLYRELGASKTADEVIRAHAEYDEEGDEHYLGQRAGLDTP